MSTSAEALPESAEPMTRPELFALLRRAKRLLDTDTPLVGADARRVCVRDIRHALDIEPMAWLVGSEPYPGPVAASKLAAGIVTPLTYDDAVRLAGDLLGGDLPAVQQLVQLVHLLMAVDIAARRQAIEDEIYGSAEGK